MTGISEILVLILLICGIIILPRMFKPAPKANSLSEGIVKKSFGRKLRAAIVASILYPAIFAFFFKPWQDGNHTLFIFAGILPVLMVWAVAWVVSAPRK